MLTILENTYHLILVIDYYLAILIRKLVSYNKSRITLSNYINNEDTGYGKPTLMKVIFHD
jgi:hypothetical protein